MNSLAKKYYKMPRQIALFFLFAFYSALFFNIVIFSGSEWKLVYFVIFSGLISIFFLKKIIINKTILFFCLSPFFLITLNEYFINNQPALNLEDYYTENLLKNISLQYIYIIPLILIPTAIKYTKFKTQLFYSLIVILTTFSLIINFIINIRLDFNRAAFATHFEAVILYDYIIISLTLIATLYTIQIKNKAAPFLIIFCALNIGVIALHGSRGAWLGIPIILLFIYISYFKSHKKNVITSAAAITLISLAITLTPNSPIMKRLENVKSDQTLLVQSNYNSSIGNRIALWKYSVELFKQEAITGVGIKNFYKEVCKLKEKKIIPDCNPHAHNIIFQEIATHGFMGIIALIFKFLIPLAYFISAWRRNGNDKLKLLSMTGISYVTYIFICGMTDYYFFMAFPTLIFYVVILTLIGFIIRFESEHDPRKLI